MIDRRNLFDQPVKNDLRTYDDIPKMKTDQEDGFPDFQIILISNIL